MRTFPISRRCMPRRGKRKRSETGVGSRVSGVEETRSISGSRPPTPDSHPRSPMPSDVALAPLQEWMQAVVTHPSDVYEAADAAEIAVGDVILPSRTLQPVERVGIYHGMYMMR